MYFCLPEGEEIRSRWNLGKLSDRLDDSLVVPGFDALEDAGRWRVLLSAFSELALVRSGLSLAQLDSSSDEGSSSSGDPSDSQSQSRVVRAPLKRARVDEGGTSRGIDEDVQRPEPVSSPVPADFPGSDTVLSPVLATSGEVAPTLPPPTGEPIVVSSGEDSHGVRLSSHPVCSEGHPEARGQPSGSSSSLRKGDSPSSSVRGTHEMVKAIEH